MAEVDAMKFVHPNCWAASLGGCDDKISSEHVVSRGLFESDQVAVQGFGWCRNEHKLIGLSALVAKILCRTHNSGLSVLDDAALDAFKVFREVIRINQVRGKLKRTSWTVKRFKVNGPLLERWFLKTLINLSFCGEWAIGLGSHKRGTPSERLVKIVFGREAFEPYAGLYLASYPGENVDSMDRVSFHTHD
jgi:hypothetical protein